MQAVQAIHNWSVLYPSVYLGCVLILLCIVCAGWYRLGVTRLAVAGASAGPHVVLWWRPHPFTQSVLVQAGSISVLGRLESSDTHVGASLAVRWQL